MKKLVVLLVGVCVLVSSSRTTGKGPVFGQTAPQVPGISAGASARADLDFGRVPLYFVPNQGQLDARVTFSIQGRDKTVYFTSEGLTLLLRQPEAEGPANRTEAGAAWKERGKAGGEAALEQGITTPRYVVKLDFVGANPGIKPVGEEETGGVISYFKGKPADWKTGLPTYSRIVYRDLWPGIDLAYSGTVNRLKYEFIVHPGADPSSIRLAYRGVDGISVDREGRLEVRTAAGGFTDDIPVAYQEFGGARTAVSLGYRVDVSEPGGGGGEATRTAMDAGAGARRFGFEVGDYDAAHALVLDPGLFIYAGFIGGSGEDGSPGIAVDGAGNAYVVGSTLSTESTFPETVGPDLSHNGNYDVFIAKVAAAGTGLVYCGFIGGTENDSGSDVSVDASGNAYVTGSTGSTQASFPVISGFDMTHNGLMDAFVAKVNAAGDALTYCTYVGGSADDYSRGIAVDSLGNAYLAGYTGSTEATFSEITGPDLSYNGGTYDGFVCKINSAGSGRYYCGYIGGSGEDRANAVAVDASGNVYLAGTTDSDQTTFPVVVGPDLTYSQYSDAFVAKITSSGTALAYCGYLAGSGYDYGYGIAVDAKGCAYVVGSSGGGLPTLVGPDLTFNGWGYRDAFVAKVSPVGDALNYCGYIGGDNVDDGYGIAVDPSGNAYIAGYAQSNPAAGFPVIDGPDLTFSGGSDGFIAQVNASGSKLVYCGYIGGDGGEDSEGVAVDPWGNAYVTGMVSSGTNFPALAGPDLSHNGAWDAYVAKVYHYWTPEQHSAIGDFDGDGTEELAVDLGTNGAWVYDTGSWTQLSAMNPEGMITANADPDTSDELFIEFGYAGLWLWNGGVMDLLSEENAETMAAGDLDGDGSDELAVDFGAVGLWLYDGGTWNQLSGVNVELLAVDQLDGSGGAELVGDFGMVGLWELSGGSWTQLSGVNLQSMATANTEGAGGRELIGDFGPIGLWLLSGGAWTQWSGVNVDQVEAADIDGTGDDEVFGDFAVTGLWLWNSGTWEILSGLNVDDLIAADTDGDGAKELAADFAVTGIWHWDGGSWNQISGVDPDDMTAGDLDGDSAEEIAADFGTLGLWLWNGGVWSQISALNPD